jgi:hypothetical protein
MHDDETEKASIRIHDHSSKIKWRKCMRIEPIRPFKLFSNISILAMTDELRLKLR